MKQKPMTTIRKNDKRLREEESRELKQPRQNLLCAILELLMALVVSL
jgi:hypothetical protein